MPEFENNVVNNNPPHLPALTPQTSNLDKALAKAQAEIKGATKNAKNPFFSSDYADLSQVIDAVRGPLTKHGISYTQTCADIQTIGNDQNKHVILFVDTTLRYQGEHATCMVPTPIVGKVDAHSVGSAMTYGRRYGLAALCGCPQVDDDGNSIVQVKPKQTKRVIKQQPVARKD